MCVCVRKYCCEKDVLESEIEPWADIKFELKYVTKKTESFRTLSLWRKVRVTTMSSRVFESAQSVL